eukprot:2461048-Amphidinium_carterae.1
MEKKPFTFKSRIATESVFFRWGGVHKGKVPCALVYTDSKVETGACAFRSRVTTVTASRTDSPKLQACKAATATNTWKAISAVL